MAYTVAELITNAYYLSGKNSLGFNEPTGNDLQNGVVYLNEVLAIKTANSRLIPYYTKFDFLAITDQLPGLNETVYLIPNLIEAETFNFFINGSSNSIRFASEKQSRRKYQGSSRAMNVNALQFSWYLEPCFGGAKLFTYFNPDQNYPLTIWGKFRLASVTYNQDLSLTLDLFYITYLKYALAEWICQQFNITMQPQTQRQLADIENSIVDIAQLDMTTDKISTLRGTRGGADWAWANLSDGWDRA